ncbi:unnamed protein product [Symbiodinium sp. CCMP2456]|nr:unnamed protein product [Symbiodinium sp. CCMP2456]
MSTDGLEMCLGVACEFPEEGVDVFKTPSQISAASPVEEEMEIFIHVLASMQATRPEIVRGIPVCRALQLAPLLWARGDLDALHRCSKATPKLTEFWSHSWQTKAWLKYISILFLNNSFPAFVVGTVLASVSFALWVADILPTWSRRHQYGWSLVTGVVSYYLTLLFWRSRKLAFLDIACINQTDKVRKTEGLVSMGAILKNSDQLLVLWDATYAARLWCMFAA